jgi:addiction module HigA family antidote
MSAVEVRREKAALFQWVKVAPGNRCGISGLPRLSLGRRFMSSTHNPAHPGEVLREYLPEGLGVSDAAKRLGVTRQALSALINGRAGVSASMALRLEAALGTSAEFWLAMRTNYDLWQARKRPPKVKRLGLQNKAA